MKDYPQLSLRLPAEVKARLHALSLVAARPQWRLISDAIDTYLKGRPEAEQRLVQELVGRRRARGANARRERVRTS